MDPITRRDIEFRMAEILGWVRVSIRQGNEQQARTWGAALARVGNNLSSYRGFMPRLKSKPTQATEPRKKRVIAPPSAFRLVRAADVQVLFDTNRGKKSRYLEALEQALANPDTFVEFDQPTARGAIATQAKKNHIRVLFGYGTNGKSGKLYVKVLGKDSAESTVLDFLEVHGPASLVEISDALDKAGFEDAPPKDVLQCLSQSGKIALRTVAGGTEKKWHLLPAAASK